MRCPPFHCVFHPVFRLLHAPTQPPATWADFFELCTFLTASSPPPTSENTPPGVQAQPNVYRHAGFVSFLMARVVAVVMVRIVCVCGCDCHNGRRRSISINTCGIVMRVAGLRQHGMHTRRHQGRQKPSGHGGACEAPKDQHHHQHKKEAATHAVMIRLRPRWFPGVFQWTE